MTNKEKVISNMSYTNSDFRTIYPELLDTAKSLTNKWDPSLSNESDPGNILIKEAAIVGDKNNYHVDKNVLECFPLSATQQSSARQIYDLVGYNMHWYKSAIANIGFTLLTSLTAIKIENELETDIESIPISAGKQVTDSTGEYIYTLLESTRLERLKQQKFVPAVQGIVESYEINGNNTITIDNLDENLRVYFPQNKIAENAIYVFDADTTISAYRNDVNTEENVPYWGLVDNLTQYKSGSKIFKFGLDLDSDNCYIEFPEYVSEIIGSGLNIYYTVSNGLSGNVKNSVLSSFTSPLSATIDSKDVEFDKYIAITNDASVGGKDPETLKDAYRNYKKLIGTYDTLVSRRDYQNAIFNLEEDGLPLVSNNIVTDRTSDQNLSYKVVVNNGDRDYAKSCVKKDGNEPLMKSYDVNLYLLKEPSTLTTIEGYNQSFRPDLSDTKEIIASEDIGIGQIKSVQHDLHYVNELSNSNQLFFDINNILTLKGNIITYYKVSKKEAKEIEDNVTKALINAYNSRELDFGEEINFNELLNLVKSADARILNVNLNVPQYEPKAQTLQGNDITLYENDGFSANMNNETIAKMVLAGKVQLFKFQDDFQYDFGQTSISNISEISTISTTNSVTLNSYEYEIAQNDIVQFIKPSFNVPEKFGARVGYQLKLNSDITIAPNQPYELKSNEAIKFVVYDAETDSKLAIQKGPGTIIMPIGLGLTATTEYVPDDLSYGSYLVSGQYIEILEFTQVTLDGGTNYYVVTNNKSVENSTLCYKIHLDPSVNGGEYILQQNEYLIYLTNNGNGLIVLGSGTSLVSSQVLDLVSPVTELEDIYSTNLNDVVNDWSYIPMDKSLVVRENEIVSLAGGDYVKLPDSNMRQFIGDGSTTTFNIGDIYAIGVVVKVDDVRKTLGTDYTKTNNPFTVTFTSAPTAGSIIKISYVIDSLELNQALEEISCTNYIEYKFNGDDSYSKLYTSSGLDISEYYLKGRCDFQIIANSRVAQTLTGNQTVIIDGNKDGVQGTYSIHDQSILFNYPINMLGGTNLDVRVLDETTGEYNAELKCYAFTQGNAGSYVNNGTQPINRIDSSGILVINNLDHTANDLQFKFEDTSNYKQYLIQINGTLKKLTKVTVSGSTGLSFSKSVFGNVSASVDIGDDSSNGEQVINEILVVSKDSTTSQIDTITFTFNNSVSDLNNISYLDLGYIKQEAGLNTDEINCSTIVNGHVIDYDIANEIGSANQEGKVSKYINDLITDSGEIFDWLYVVPSANKVIQPLLGESYFNPNHIYNECTIAKIDLDNSQIKVNASSIQV